MAGLLTSSNCKFHGEADEDLTAEQKVRQPAVRIGAY